VILILLTTGTAARRETYRHLKQVECTPAIVLRGVDD
jgi:hypothetical protein